MKAIQSEIQQKESTEGSGKVFKAGVHARLWDGVSTTEPLLEHSAAAATNMANSAWTRNL